MYRKRKAAPVHVMKIYGGVEVWLYTFLIPGADACGRSVSQFRHFTQNSHRLLLNRILNGSHKLSAQPGEEKKWP
jgi:hypothetical protein